MNESLFHLLERMRASRGAVAQQLDLLSMRALPRTVAGKGITITSKQIGTGLGLILAIRLLFSVRRRRKD